MKSPSHTTSRPDALIFDWDGTLVDTLPGLRIAHNHVRGIYGLELWSEEQFAQNLKYSARELYPRIYGEKAQQAMDTLYGFVMDNHLEHLTVLPGAEELIRFIVAAGIPVGLVSNKRHEVLVREVDHLGWHGLFYCVLGAGMAARDKPWADPILMALEKAATPLGPENVWFVGDTETDLLAAKAAGCPAVLITHGKDKNALKEAYKPFICAENCLSFLNIMENYMPPDAKMKSC